MPVRVLMVDDSLFGRDVLRHHLECIGCEVVAEAENTLQALGLFRTVAPSLVMLDASVPGMGGIGALNLLRIIRAESPGVPILVASAITFPAVRKAFIRVGALDYLVKPFDASSFEKICQRLVELFPELTSMEHHVGANLRLVSGIHRAQGRRITGG